MYELIAERIQLPSSDLHPHVYSHKLARSYALLLNSLAVENPQLLLDSQEVKKEIRAFATRCALHYLNERTKGPSQMQIESTAELFISSIEKAVLPLISHPRNAIVKDIRTIID